MTGSAYAPLAESLDKALDTYFDEVVRQGDQAFTEQYAAMDNLGRAATRVAFKARALEACSVVLTAQYRMLMN